MALIDPGYGIVPECLSNRECDELTEILARHPVSRGGAGVRHLMGDPSVLALANDERLTGLAEHWLHAKAVPFRATLFDKSAETNWLIPWHQDTALPFTEKFILPGWGPWSKKEGVSYSHAPASALSRVVAIRVHLDASLADNGPLRVIPRSHLAGVLSDQTVAEFVSADNHVECCVPRGGLIAMRPLIIHSSSKVKSASSRRVLHIEYADSLELEPGIRLAVV